MRLTKLIQCASALSLICGSALVYSGQSQSTPTVIEPSSITQTGTPFFFQPPASFSHMQIIPRANNFDLMALDPQQPVMIPASFLQTFYSPQPTHPSATQQRATTPATATVFNVTFKNKNASKNTTDTTTEAKNKATGSGGVGGGGVGGGGVGGGGVGGGDVSSEVQSTGGSGGRGGSGGNNNNTTHNNEYPSFPFNGYFNTDDVRKTSQGIWQSCKKHAYKIMGAAALSAYAYVYYHVRSGKIVLKDKASWCNWHKEKNNSQLFTSSQLVNELMFEIASRYSDIMQPQNVALPVQTFFSTINQELKKLQHFASLTPWLKRLHITMFFPLSDKHIQACAEKIERLEGLRNVVAQHITQQHYASITTRGFSIPIRIPLSGSSKASSKK